MLILLVFSSSVPLVPLDEVRRNVVATSETTPSLVGRDNSNPRSRQYEQGPAPLIAVTDFEKARRGHLR